MATTRTAPASLADLLDEFVGLKIVEEKLRPLRAVRREHVVHVPASPLAGDDVIGHLLLHGVRPYDGAAGVGQALAEVQPALSRQGAEVVGTLVADTVRSAAPDLGAAASAR